MTSTDELRRLLDERGVKWWPMCNNGYYEDRDTEFVVNGKKHTAHEWGNGLAVYNLTPEQAIAATLGSDEPPYDELLRCLENDWHISASWDGLRKFWCIELTEEGVRLRDAELGSGTCEALGSYYYDDYDQYEFEFSCGHSVSMYDKEPPNYCPTCGRKVVKP